MTDAHVKVTRLIVLVPKLGRGQGRGQVDPARAERGRVS